MRSRLAVLAVFAAIILAVFAKRSGPKGPPVAAPAPAASIVAPSRISGLPWVAPAKVKVEGWVVDEAKVAVVSARVCAVSIDLAHTDEESGPFCGAVSEDGRFAIEGVPAGRWDVVASAVGFLPARAEPFVDLDPVAGHPKVEIRLARGGVSVEGAVEDPLGRPVAGARVRALATTQSEVAFPDVVVMTDTAGRFSLWLPEGSVDLEASAAGYASVDDVFSAPTRKAKLALHWEAVVSGRVVDGAGVGVAGARVVAEGPEEHTARAAEDGSFVFAGLSGGRWKFAATAPGLRGALESVLVDPGHRTNGLTVVATPAARVEASIVVDDGAPCVDGSLRLRDAATDETLYASTDGKGAVRFDAVSPGAWEVEVECVDKDGSGERPNLVVAAADVSGLVYTVRKGLVGRGIVVDEKGAPVEGVSVSADLEGKTSRYLTATTGKDGTFRIGGLSRGSWRLSARDVRFVEATMKLEVEAADVAGIRLVASSGAVLRGKVVDGAGVGLAHVDVQVEGASSHTALTRDDGSFRVAGLAPGDHVVWASKNGGRLTFLVPTQKTDDGEGIAFVAPEKGELAVDLRVSAPNLVITGKVVDSSGAPVVEASVYWRREWHDEEGAGEGPDVVLTDSEGRFRVTGLATGNYSLLARKKGAGEVLTAHVPAGGIAFMTLREHASLTAVLATRVRSARVRLEDRKSGLSFQELVVDGDRARFDDLPDGTYELSVACAEGGGYEKVVLAARDAKTVSVALSPWASVTGSFVAGPDARVSVHCEDCVRAQYASVDLVGGAFRADHLLAGTYAVEIYDQRPLARGKVVLAAGAVATVVLEAIPETLPEAEPIVAPGTPGNAPPLDDEPVAEEDAAAPPNEEPEDEG